MKADSQLVEGFMSRVKVRDFEVIVDQHEGMGGSPRVLVRSEYVLAALAACHEVTYRLHADALGIALESVSVSITGHSDARGFFRLTKMRARVSQRLREKSEFEAAPVTTI